MLYSVLHYWITLVLLAVAVIAGLFGMGGGGGGGMKPKHFNLGFYLLEAHEG